MMKMMTMMMKVSCIGITKFFIYLLLGLLPFGV